jgi:hypothetical protein
VKRSGRDEPIQVAVHMFMEAILGISLYKLCLPQANKNIQQNWRKGQNRFCLEARGVGERGTDDPNNVCTYE